MVLTDRGPLRWTAARSRLRAIEPDFHYHLNLPHLLCFLPTSLILILLQRWVRHQLVASTRPQDQEFRFWRDGHHSPPLLRPTCTRIRDVGALVLRLDGRKRRRQN